MPPYPVHQPSPQMHSHHQQRQATVVPSVPSVQMPMPYNNNNNNNFLAPHASSQNNLVPAPAANSSRQSQNDDDDDAPPSYFKIDKLQN
jgi:hypothetical protein